MTGFIVAQLLRHLHRTGSINLNMTSFQMVRIFFINLLQVDLREVGVSFSSDQEAIRLAHLQWDVVFLDSTGLLNFTASMSKLSYGRIQHEARSALKIIDNGDVAGFMALFLTKVKFMFNFDHVIRSVNLIFSIIIFTNEGYAIT